MKDTDLKIEIVSKGELITPFSARECTQTLTPIPQGIMRRTVGGELKCLSGHGHQKFKSLIRCKDKASPSFDGIWQGALLKITCIQSLTQTVPTRIMDIQLDRESVDHHLFDTSGKEWAIQLPNSRWVSIPTDFPGGFITYRPILSMMVRNYTLETDEWGLSVGWTLELEEA